MLLIIFFVWVPRLACPCLLGTGPSGEGRCGCQTHIPHSGIAWGPGLIIRLLSCFWKVGLNGAGTLWILWIQSQWVQSNSLGKKNKKSLPGPRSKPKGKLFLKRKIVIFRRQHNFTPKFKRPVLLFISRELPMTLYSIHICYRHLRTIELAGLCGPSGRAALTASSVDLSHSFRLLCFLLKTVIIKRLLSKCTDQSRIPKWSTDCLKIQRGTLGVVSCS